MRCIRLEGNNLIFVAESYNNNYVSVEAQKSVERKSRII